MLTWHPRRKATASVEFAVILPLLLLFLLGSWEVGRLIQTKQLLSNAAREGARQAASGNFTTAEIQANVVRYLELNGIQGVNPEDVQVRNVTANSSSDPKSASQLDEYEVTVTIQFNSVKWIILDQITDTTTLSASANWNSMRDLPVEVDSTIPQN